MAATHNTRTDPAVWLRLRPEITDSPDEFLRDWRHWSRAMMRQDGFAWGDFAWFHERAQQLQAHCDACRNQARWLHEALERYGSHDATCAYVVEGGQGGCSCGFEYAAGDYASSRGGACDD